jgi:acyl dehydratase
MQFEDLSPGDELEPRIVEDVRGDDMRLLAALLEDPYPVHFDERAADDHGYPDLLNQGPANCSYLLQTVVRELDSPSDVRSYDFRFQDMVFAGETVTATATVEDTRVVDAAGIVEFSVALEKEDGTVAVDGTVTAQLPRA